MVSLVSVLFSVLLRQKPFVRRHIYNLSTPATVHKVLTSEDIGDRCVFVVGDVHGCCDELKDIVAEARKEDENTLFLLVGDLINKGPKNIEVLDFLKTLNCFAVRGNHDDFVLREVNKLKEDSSYKLKDGCAWMADLTTEHLNYLENLPYTLTIPSLNSIIVHAGLIPGKPLEFTDYNTFTNVRNIVEEDYFDGKGLVGTNGINEGVPWATLWPGPEHVYFGHDARRKLQICPFATGLDTGCLYGGCLTGIFLNGPKRMIQIPAKKVYKDPFADK